MKISNHIKLAGYTGLVLGMIIGTINIIAKIIALNFEWYEFYQTLLISPLILMCCFIILALFIELFKKIIKFRISKKFLLRFYITTSIFLILLFYGEIFINKYLHFLIPFNVKTILRLGTQINFSASFIYLLIVLSIYILLLTKKRNLIDNLILFFKTNNNTNRLIKNYVFVIIMFVIISFSMDLYLLNDVTTSFTLKEELKTYPNILIITLDAVRPDHLSLYGYPLNTTPNLDRFAEKAVIFENVVSPGSWTLPSHASIFTGKYPFHHNAVKRHQKLDNKEITLAEILKAKGYNTAGFIGSDYFLNTKFGSGQGFSIYRDRLDFFEYASSFDRFSITNILYMFFPNIYKFIFNADGKRTAEEINENIFRWLDKNKNKQPFFMFINYYDAPYYLAPQKLDIKFIRQFTNKSIDFKKIDKIIRLQNYNLLSRDTIKNMIALYDAGICYMDYYLEKLFDKFDELGILNNTIIIITADHGEEFYEHKSLTHGSNLYEESIRVPLIIYYPKEFDAKRIKTRVGNINIFSTVLDILKIKIPENINSVSLLPLIIGSDYSKEYTYSEILNPNSEQRTVTLGDWKLIEFMNESDKISYELYNLKEDPQEQNNQYGENKKEKEQLVMQLNAIKRI